MTADALAGLPATFRYSEAAEAIGESRLRALAAKGVIVPMARGLYRKSDWAGDEDLIEIAAKSKRATLCLRSALARHDLIDDIPATIDVAMPRGAWQPNLRPPIRWHHFDTATFDLGRDLLDVGAGRTIGLYSPERSILDAYRLRHREGEDMAHEALKRWLKAGGQPSQLLKLARAFPRVLPVLRSTLEVLL
ncbi:MAG: hypothetical protein LBS27_04870 [Bifidobacteriaceae bacterium]|jgi:hypothetical protein|nr:hypothetical protein [Bifidobacteriaceae bacterium]